MGKMTHPKKRLAVIYDAAAGPKAYRVAGDIGTGAWDAGSGVGVRRLGELVVPPGSASHADWAEMLDHAADIPEAGPADLEWANIALVVSGLTSQRPWYPAALRWACASAFDE